MAIYEFKCDSCGNVQESYHSMLSNVVEEVCEQCGQVAKKIMSQTAPAILNGAGWPSRDLKTNSFRKKRYEEMGKKQQERYGESAIGGKLKPNVGGEECDSWVDASKLAKEKGLDHTSYLEKALSGT